VVAAIRDAPKMGLAAVVVHPATRPAIARKPLGVMRRWPNG